MRIRSQNINVEVKKLFFLSLTIFLLLISWIITSFKPHGRKYLIFVEFENAHGIQKGTPLRLRGSSIGYVTEVSAELNSVLAMIKIDSSSTIIPRNSLVETNQTGLLNESVIDILPLELLVRSANQALDPFSDTCINSKIICHLSYLEGDRGLNYDDLVRATTRISQRFDDPRFFNLFYVFLQNGIELSDHVLAASSNLSDFIYVLYDKLQNNL
jgi:phospholipid/cholesterol/gamma-HCH transport system substrate-binding protein